MADTYTPYTRRCGLNSVPRSLLLHTSLGAARWSPPRTGARRRWMRLPRHGAFQRLRNGFPGLEPEISDAALRTPSGPIRLRDSGLPVGQKESVAQFTGVGIPIGKIVVAIQAGGVPWTGGVMTSTSRADASWTWTVRCALPERQLGGRWHGTDDAARGHVPQPCPARRHGRI